MRVLNLNVLKKTYNHACMFRSNYERSHTKSQPEGFHHSGQEFFLFFPENVVSTRKLEMIYTSSKYKYICRVSYSDDNSTFSSTILSQCSGLNGATGSLAEWSDGIADWAKNMTQRTKNIRLKKEDSFGNVIQYMTGDK